jgi:PAS domain S-box-containing protein
VAGAEHLDDRTSELADERTLREILDQLPVAVSVVEPSGRLVHANRRARELLGDRVEDATLDGFGRENGKGSPIERALRGETVPAEAVSLVRPDGTVAILEARAAPVHDESGGVTAAVAIFDDVTERETRDRADRDFVSNAAHQLRTPIAAIASAVAVLQGGAKDTPVERDVFLAHIERETDRLARLGRALLTLARAQRREEEPVFEVVPLRRLLDDLVAEANAPKAVKVEVQCATSVGAIAHRELLEEALANLLANAVRYTDRGHVRVAARRRGADVVVTIVDTGRGITAEERPRVFERFYRASERDAGFGLGLPIAAEAIRFAGGTLTLESAEGVGTTARVTLRGARIVT